MNKIQIWHHNDWPNFEYDTQSIQNTLYQYASEINKCSSQLSAMEPNARQDTHINLMVDEGVYTSQIESEDYIPSDVRSSIRNLLGLNTPEEALENPRVKGVSRLMIDVRDSFRDPLTAERLFSWQDMIITDQFLRKRLAIGRWRDDEVRIVSGPIGREKTHYIAPPPERVPSEIEKFIDWFNSTIPLPKRVSIPAPVRAAVIHLYFEVIHPFSDGNGRIGRALSEIALSQELGSPVPLSLSKTIKKRQSAYYRELNQASHGDMNITRWVDWFVKIIEEAVTDSHDIVNFSIAQSLFWKRYEDKLNSRQIRVIKRMLREGIEGFQDGMSSRKYCKIGDCSSATATRDLSELAQLQIFGRLPAGGRSTRYELVLPEPSDGRYNYQDGA